MAGSIRVGLIGLSASATGTGWAGVAHLPYLLNTPYFKITALLNSSIENSKKAIQAYNLPAETKAYDKPEDLASDPEVDLVVANVRVDRHAQVLLPSIMAGKDVYCEWPLDKNGEVARSMAEAAKVSGGRTIVGLQARFSPTVQKVKQLVESGRIGRPLSSTIIGAAGSGGLAEPANVEYTVNRKIGGNILSIHFGHSTCSISLSSR
jgi:predicted dehydrogenase